MVITAWVAKFWRSEEVGEADGKGRARDQDDPKEGEQAGRGIIDA